MATNQYLPFAVASGANVLSYAAYLTDAARDTGNLPGVARSEFANTTWRTSAVAVSGIAQAMCDTLGVDIVDDGNRNNFRDQFLALINNLISAQQGWKTGDVKATLDPIDQAGWVLANGVAVSRTGATAALFAKFGTTYGAGDGSTTFNLPNLCAEFLRGVDSGRGIDPGRVLGSSQAEMIGSHTHDNNWPMWDEGGQSNNHMASGGGGAESVTFQLPTGNVTGTHTENRPRNVAVRYLIKL